MEQTVNEKIKELLQTMAEELIEAKEMIESGEMTKPGLQDVHDNLIDRAAILNWILEGFEE